MRSSRDRAFQFLAARSVTVTIRPAVPGDEGAIFDLVRELAVYERLAHEVEATAGALRAALFAPAPRAFCDLAEDGGQPIGFALWFYNFSTFLGRHGIYLEDLFVAPAWRGRGVGAALLQHLARRCVAEELGRLEWAVLDWNKPAIDFYRGRGARLFDDWRLCRLTGEALRQLAAPAG